MKKDSFKTRIGGMIKGFGSGTSGGHAMPSSPSKHEGASSSAKVTKAKSTAPAAFNSERASAAKQRPAEGNTRNNAPGKAKYKTPKTHG